MQDIEQKKAARLKAEVERALVRIAQMNDANALKRLHANIERHADLGDLDRERLNEATMSRLRVVAPAMATRLGGPKDTEGRDFLQKVYEQASMKFDLSDNKVGQGVKTGGWMINGTRYVDVYLSYKTIDGKNLSFAWIQEKVDSQPYLELLLRQVGRDGAGELINETFSDPNAATDRYLAELENLSIIARSD